MAGPDRAIGVAGWELSRDRWQAPNAEAIVLPDNAPIIGLFRKYAPAARWRHGRDHFTVDIPLAPAAIRLPAAA